MALGSGWYYNSVSGSIIDQPPLLGIPQSWFPDWHGPFPTKEAAIQYAQTHGGAQPSGLAGAVTNTVGTAAQDAVSSASPLGPLFQKNIWLRVAEVGIGVVLLAIGLNAMLKGKPFQVVTGAAGTVGKVVP